jgi:cation:H+ antiporter
MLWPLVQLAGGFALLVLGGNALVHGASALAARLGISPLVIGLTVVAWGTSAPELAVSLRAALADKADLALGNVVGSNIFNLLGVLGASALVAPLAVSRRVIRLDMPILIALSTLVYLLALDRRIGRMDGLLFLAAGAAYTALLLRSSRAESDPAERAARGPSLPLQLGLVAAGLALLVVGAGWLVAGASQIARGMGVSELVIGLTVVAVGTSLPEVAASVVAAFRGERDIAVGNVVGSNIFNITAVLGLTAGVTTGGLPVADAALAFDIPVMLAVAVACLPVLYTGASVTRGEGALLVAYYGAYSLYLVLAAQRHDLLPLFSRTLLYFVAPLTAFALLVLVRRELLRRPER